MPFSQESLNSQAWCSLLHQIRLHYGSNIGDNDYQFLERIYRDGLHKYLDRLKSIGFCGNQRILDAGCGYGQWSLALAQLNEMVLSCDISPLRVSVLQKLATQIGFTNIASEVSGIDIMTYPDQHFDAVFCYGVIFLTPWRQSLAELARVLKPGGKLYVNANGLGWYMFLWQEEHNKADDYDPKAIAAQTFLDTLRYDRDGVYKQGMNLIIEPKSIETELQRLGFQDIKLAAEGALHLNKAVTSPRPFFKGEYYGQPGIFEATGTKR
ncbi:class I SAM-dependent methyltransferase [Synechococcus sp. BIOS-E4-1]|uniref:class I SAM-dependent methyltransferase n=1 Tax=Synechococcus sp. BIOS-E4-1 TaxID=1400864 RepID=UPI001648B4A9|nr:class I SAM-dependent methyltransferase [Synechococcus sp. BIOS-E4-1]